MSGMFETWLGSLVAALQVREKDANVVVVDWLPLAHQLYTDAVNNTRIVGQSIAKLLDWLQVTRVPSGGCRNAARGTVAQTGAFSSSSAGLWGNPKARWGNGSQLEGLRSAPVPRIPGGSCWAVCSEQWRGGGLRM